MKQILKTMAVLAVSGAMVFAMSVPAWATDPVSGLNTSTTVTDTTSINLIKDYVAAETGTSNTTTFTFKITPYGVWNAGSSTGVAGGDAYTKDNMPTFGTNTYTFSGTTGSKTAQSITLPTTYKSVGDFWYTVQETASTVTTANDTTAAANATTGVIYGTNDSETETIANENGDHKATYYLHVQVTNGTSGFVRTVTLHKTAPTSGITNAAYNTWTASNYVSSVKVDNVQNKYYAGSLTIKKTVTGNAGDKDKRFPVVVTFTKPAGTVITSDISYTAVLADGGTATASTIKAQNSTTDSSWYTGLTSDKSITGFDDAGTYKSTSAMALTGNSTNAGYAQTVIWIKDGESVTFSNIPYGVTYTVAELKPDDETYTNKLVFTSSGETSTTSFDGAELAADVGKAGASDATGDYFGDSNAATGSIADASDELTITNDKAITIDVGVVIDNAPYIAILVIAAIGGLYVVSRRRKKIEE